MNNQCDKKMLMDGVLQTNLDPKARLDLVRNSGAVLYEYLGGSHAYGTSLPTSDEDFRGVFCMPLSEDVCLKQSLSLGQVSDDRKLEGQKVKNDDIFYTLRRFFELLKGANPNIIEALWIPQDCILRESREIKQVIANRGLFISKACLGSHFGYAKNQIDKAKGKNKKVNNPQPVEKPLKLDFCRVIACIPGTQPWTNPDVPSASRFPFRPVPLKDMPWVNLAHYHVAAVEHSINQYRMYYYGEEAKGVFRGDDMLVCESIPMDDEHPRFSGVLLYNEQEYELAVAAWNSYWDWMRNRNVHRWVDQKKGLVDYDAKNMMHCVRLLMSGLNIIKNGEPIVRFEGDDQKHLMDIRMGKLKYEEIMDEVKCRVLEMEEAAVSSNIPKKVDDDAIENLYADVCLSARSRLFGESYHVSK